MSKTSYNESSLPSFQHSLLPMSYRQFDSSLASLSILEESELSTETTLCQQANNNNNHNSNDQLINECRLIHDICDSADPDQQDTAFSFRARCHSWPARRQSVDKFPTSASVCQGHEKATIRNNILLVPRDMAESGKNNNNNNAAADDGFINISSSFPTVRHGDGEPVKLELRDTTAHFHVEGRPRHSTFHADPRQAALVQQLMTTPVPSTSSNASTSISSCPPAPVNQLYRRASVGSSNNLDLKSTANSQKTRRGTSRRNPWGNLSYAELIEQAIESSEEEKMTLSQIYGHLVENFEYFANRCSPTASSGWKNSIRHNLSLHDKFVRMTSECGRKTSFWTLEREAVRTQSKREGTTSGAKSAKKLPCAIGTKRSSLDSTDRATSKSSPSDGDKTKNKIEISRQNFHRQRSNTLSSLTKPVQFKSSKRPQIGKLCRMDKVQSFQGYELLNTPHIDDPVPSASIDFRSEGLTDSMSFRNRSYSAASPLRYRHAECPSPYYLPSNSGNNSGCGSLCDVYTPQFNQRSSPHANYPFVPIDWSIGTLSHPTDHVQTGNIPSTMQPTSQLQLSPPPSLPPVQPNQVASFDDQQCNIQNLNLVNSTELAYGSGGYNSEPEHVRQFQNYFINSQDNLLPAVPRSYEESVGSVETSYSPLLQSYYLTSLDIPSLIKTTSTSVENRIQLE